MKRRSILSMFVGGAAMAALPVLAAPNWPQVEVFKSPYCGCCGAWVEHMRAAGFAVNVTLVNDTTAARKRLGMPDAFGSCHTATVAGYVLEGHVPADDVKRLLVAKPVVVGLAVPGMPPGSPGMETGQRKDPYDVLVIDKGGHAAVFSHYPKA
jgi:hypothetical protein